MLVVCGLVPVAATYESAGTVGLAHAGTINLCIDGPSRRVSSKSSAIVRASLDSKRWRTCLTADVCPFITAQIRGGRPRRVAEKPPHLSPNFLIISTEAGDIFTRFE